MTSDVGNVGFTRRQFVNARMMVEEQAVNQVRHWQVVQDQADARGEALEASCYENTGTHAKPIVDPRFILASMAMLTYGISVAK
jgi:hypothetical protein